MEANPSVKEDRSQNKSKLMVLGLILTILFFSLAAILAAKNIQAGKEADKNTRALAVSLLSAMDKAPAIPENYPEEVIPDYILDPDREMPVVEIDGMACIGILSFPDRDLTFPVASKWSYDDLEKAACRYWGSVYKDDAVLFAHNYEGQFDFLPELKPGEKVIFTDMDQNEFQYKMISGATLWPRQTKEMVSKDDANWDLTLFTCTTWGEARITVRLARTSPEK